MCPAEKHVTGRLHGPITVHDALPMVAKLALARVRRQHRSTSLFDLKEQRIIIRRHKQQDPARGTDTADPHHLDGGVTELVTIEQRVVGRWKRGTVIGEPVEQDPLYLPRRHILLMKDGGELILDGGNTTLAFGQLWKHLLAAALRLF